MVEHFNARRRLDEGGKLVLELGDTVGKMKRKYGVDKVLAWHAMAGYWAGVEPEATEMACFEPRVTKLVAPKGIREADPKVRAALYIVLRTHIPATISSPRKIQKTRMDYPRLDCDVNTKRGLYVPASGMHQSLCFYN